MACASVSARVTASAGPKCRPIAKPHSCGQSTRIAGQSDETCTHLLGLEHELLEGLGAGTHSSKRALRSGAFLQGTHKGVVHACVHDCAARRQTCLARIERQAASRIAFVPSTCRQQWNEIRRQRLEIELARLLGHESAERIDAQRKCAAEPADPVEVRVGGKSHRQAVVVALASNARVAVVGAGPGGLATAVLLAARGVAVTVYEAQPSIGGRTGRLTLGNFHFDRGPTFFLMPHLLEEIFRVAGRSLHDYVRLTRLDPMYRLVIGQPKSEDIVLDTTQDLAEMARRIERVHAPDGAAFERFVAHNRRKLALAEPLLRRSMRSLWDLVRLDALRALSVLKPHLSVHELAARYFEHPALQLAVGFQSKYLGMSPHDCPSLFTILPFIEYEYGVWHPQGGCHALMQALTRVLEELGGRIEVEAPVERLEFHRGRVTHVIVGGRHRGERAACDHVVINADATWAVKKLIPESMRGALTDRSLDARRYSCSTFMLYLGIDGDVELPHHTIRTAPDYRENLEDIGRGGGRLGTLTEDPSFYVCNPSRTDQTLAPRGDSSLYVLMPTPNAFAPLDWDAERPRVRELLLDRLQRVLGVDLRGRIRVDKSFTPWDWRAMNINAGATFNLAHSMTQLLHRRMPHRLPYARGAWLVGGGTHPGSGLPVIFLSAQITARLLLEELGVSGRESEVPFTGAAVRAHSRVLP